MNSPNESKRHATWRMTAFIFATATAINYVWELAQSPLYAGMGDFSLMLWHCLPPSLGDGLLVLLIFAAGWLVLRDRDWFRQPGIRGYALMLIAGLLIAISVELVAVHIFGGWTYTSRMPLVPVLNVGLVPIVQMLVLPPIIFRVVAVCLRLNA